MVQPKVMTMNFETGFETQGTATDFADPGALDHRRRRRRVIVIASIVGLLAIVGAWLLFGNKGGAPKDANSGAKQIPTVSVMVPGRQNIARTVSATGNLAARREMPVGVAGEGGMISQVLVEPGQWVGAGQVLATIDRRVQSQQAASLGSQIAVAEADARLAQSELERAQQLVARGFISKADIDRKMATRDAARARVNVARATYQQSLASNARLDVRAPAPGLVLERKVEPGQIVSAGSGMLFRLAKGGEIEMLARLGEADLARMSVGQQATIIPVGSTQAFKGQIWQVSPVVDPQTRQGIVRIAVPYDKALRPGGFATAMVVSGAADVPLLPESAVQSDAKGNYVYIVGKGNKVERRPVKVGDVNDKGVTILDGLSGQEPVVVSAGAFLNPGETIIPQRVKAPN